MDPELVTSEIANLQNEKQDTLVSGQNIKTVNGNDITGPGDVVISSAGSSTAKVYLAILHQTGTNNPIATVLNSNDKNFLGELNWVRDAVGKYSVTSDLFVKNKTFVNGKNPFSDGIITVGKRLEPKLFECNDAPTAIYVSLYATDSATKKIELRSIDQNLGGFTDGIITTYGILVEIVIFD